MYSRYSSDTQACRPIQWLHRQFQLIHSTYGYTQIYRILQWIQSIIQNAPVNTPRPTDHLLRTYPSLHLHTDKLATVLHTGNERGVGRMFCTPCTAWGSASKGRNKQLRIKTLSWFQRSVRICWSHCNNHTTVSSCHQSLVIVNDRNMWVQNKMWTNTNVLTYVYYEGVKPHSTRRNKKNTKGKD
jgi:hypothetical protein